MKVAVICDVLGQANNGTTIAALNLIRTLREKGHEVRVVCPDAERAGEPGYYIVPKYDFHVFNDYVEKNGVAPAKLDTEAFLWEVYETWQPVAAKAGDRLTLRLPDGALPPIRADEDALKQVMAILLSNAVQHTPSGTQIELSAVAAGRTVCLSVADTGPGIADKERAFQKFYRADPQTGDASLGLGLSIAQKLVALHHGSITIRDTPGGGATLQVTIPQA